MIYRMLILLLNFFKLFKCIKTNPRDSVATGSINPHSHTHSPLYPSLLRHRQLCLDSPQVPHLCPRRATPRSSSPASRELPAPPSLHVVPTASLSVSIGTSILFLVVPFFFFTSNSASLVDLKASFLGLIVVCFERNLGELFS